MAITRTLNRYQIIDIANQYGRLDNFGYKGWQKLFDYLEELSEDTREDMEVDIIAWCCDYTMFESPQEVFDAYDTDIDNGDWQEMDEEEKLEAVESYLQENTSVVCCEEDCIIFAKF